MGTIYQTIRLPDPQDVPDRGFSITIEQDGDFFVAGVLNCWSYVLAKAGKYTLAIETDSNANGPFGAKYWKFLDDPILSDHGDKTDLNTALRPEIAAFALAMEKQMRIPGAQKSSTECTWWQNTNLKSLHEDVKIWVDRTWGAVLSDRITDDAYRPLPKTDPQYGTWAAEALDSVLRSAIMAASGLMMISNACGCLDLDEEKNNV